LHSHKKWKYWLKGVPGEAMQAFFNGDGVNVRDCHAFQGMIERTMYNLWGMKEPDYIMLMMATNGLLGGNESCRMASCWWNEGGVEVVWTFHYTCPFDWHFQYWHAVDDHNSPQLGLPLIKDSWTMQWWETHVFLFILAITKVNAFFCLQYFILEKGPWQDVPHSLHFTRDWHGK
jgi:hypothetical protein